MTIFSKKQRRRQKIFTKKGLFLIKILTLSDFLEKMVKKFFSDNPGQNQRGYPQVKFRAFGAKGGGIPRIPPLAYATDKAVPKNFCFCKNKIKRKNKTFRFFSKTKICNQFRICKNKGTMPRIKHQIKGHQLRTQIKAPEFRTQIKVLN